VLLIALLTQLGEQIWRGEGAVQSVARGVGGPRVKDYSDPQTSGGRSWCCAGAGGSVGCWSGQVHAGTARTSTGQEGGEPANRLDSMSSSVVCSEHLTRAQTETNTTTHRRSYDWIHSDFHSLSLMWWRWEDGLLSMIWSRESVSLLLFSNVSQGSSGSDARHVTLVLVERLLVECQTENAYFFKATQKRKGMFLCHPDLYVIFLVVVGQITDLDSGWTFVINTWTLYLFSCCRRRARLICDVVTKRLCVLHKKSIF